MNVNELLDTIEDLLEESTGMPLSGGKRIVDVEQIRDYLDDIRAFLPVVLPAEVGGMPLKKQYKYGKVLLWKYGKPRQSAGEGDAE